MHAIRLEKAIYKIMGKVLCMKILLSDGEVITKYEKRES